MFWLFFCSFQLNDVVYKKLNCQLLSLCENCSIQNWKQQDHIGKVCENYSNKNKTQTYFHFTVALYRVMLQKVPKTCEIIAST